jgi:aminotransferase
MGIGCFEAEGAFYVFPSVPAGFDDAETFAEELLNGAGVAVVPGTAFGDAGAGHVRMSYATGIDELREAMDRIEAFLN